MRTTVTTLMLAASMLLGCASDPEPRAEPPDDVGPVEWVTYAGDAGPGAGRHVVLVSGDEEYRSEEALPQLARILAERHGFTCTVLFAQDPARPGVVDPNYVRNIPGLEHLDEADLMVLFTRFRALPDDQMAHVAQYLMEGKPLIAIRTATHAFEFRDTTSAWNHWSNSFSDEGSPWDGGFGRLVLGEKWHTHHGHHKHQSTRGVIAPGAADHPITNGLDDADVWGPTDVYGVRLPMPEGVTPLVLGQVVDRAGAFDEDDLLFGMRPADSAAADVNPASNTPYDPNDPMMPIAWTKPYRLPDGEPGLAFTSTIGASTDLLSAGVRRLLVNAVYYMLEMDVPERADVGLVGDYRPTAFNFHSDEYWDEKDLNVSDYVDAGE